MYQFLKMGDINEVSNYRGIILLSTLGKLFTRILNTRLNEWAEEYNVYIEAQAGFRKHMSTVEPRQANLCLRAFRHDTF